MLGLNDFTIDDIRALADVMHEKHLGRIELKNGASEVAIDGARPMPPAPHGYMQGMGMPMGMPVNMGMNMPAMTPPPVQLDPMPDTENSASGKAAPNVEAQTAFNGNVVKAPIVGTFYASPAPGKPPFVTVGQKVKKGDVIMIIESMKLMNEVQSEYDGEVAEIMAKDGQPVEYDQPVMIIK